MFHSICTGCLGVFCLNVPNHEEVEDTETSLQETTRVHELDDDSYSEISDVDSDEETLNRLHTGSESSGNDS